MKKIWKLLLVVLIVIIAFYFPVILATMAQWMASVGFAIPAGFVASLATIPWWVGAVVGVGLAYLIDPDTTKEIISDAGEIVKEVGSVVADATSSVVGSFLSSPLGLVAAGFGLFWLFGRREDDDKQMIQGEKK